MNVTLIAYTDVDLSAMYDSTNEEWYPDEQATGPDLLAEFAGRACYQSWSKPNPKTASNHDYVANVIGLGHESVLSHASATFYATGVSRSLTHELVRHRFLSFSELSQRYVTPESLSMVVPPALEGTDDVADLSMSFADSKAVYDYLVMRMEKRGVTGKKAREAARAVLPNCVETRIVVSGNLRAWRDFLKQRLSTHADAEIRKFAQEVFLRLNGIAPNTMIGVLDEALG